MKSYAEIVWSDGCPHCGTPNPLMRRVWKSVHRAPLSGPLTADTPRNWASYSCTSCGGVVSVKSGINATGLENWPIERMYPAQRRASSELPATAREYMRQAIETSHAPDAAAVMAASAVDAMLKDKGLEDGSLNARLGEAVTNGLLTASMADWAHRVRLDSNAVRHADGENPHLTPEQAIRCVEFAEALGAFLYVLPSKMPPDPAEEPGDNTED